MKRLHAAVISLIAGLALAIGGYAATRPTDVGSTSNAAPTSAASAPGLTAADVTARTRDLARAERALKRRLARARTRAQRRVVVRTRQSPSAAIPQSSQPSIATTRRSVDDDGHATEDERGERDD